MSWFLSSTILPFFSLGSLFFHQVAGRRLALISKGLLRNLDVDVEK